MTQKKNQCPKLNSQVTKAEEKKVKKGLKDAFTVEELAAIKASSRSNVSLMVGASIVMKDTKDAMPQNRIIQFANEVKDAVRKSTSPWILYYYIFEIPLIRDFLLTMYANGIDHEQRIQEVLAGIDEEVAQNPELKKHLDELTEKYKKQMEEARLKQEEAEKAAAEEAAKKAAEEQKNTPKH